MAQIAREDADDRGSTEDHQHARAAGLAPSSALRSSVCNAQVVEDLKVPLVRHDEQDAACQRQEIAFPQLATAAKREHQAHLVSCSQTTVMWLHQVGVMVSSAILDDEISM